MISRNRLGTKGQRTLAGSCCPGPAGPMAVDGGPMPSRRTFELIVITVILMAPALSMVQLWARKHLATTANGASSEAAAVVTAVL
jgi:hypothetical protein